MPLVAHSTLSAAKIVVLDGRTYPELRLLSLIIFTTQKTIIKDFYCPPYTLYDIKRAELMKYVLPYGIYSLIDHNSHTVRHEFQGA